MDAQHGILIDAINDLRQALMQGAARERIAKELNRILDFSRMHFASEEQLLELHNYPGLAEHREVHQRLLHQIREAAQRSQRGEQVETRSLLEFLRRWYTEHIETLDKPYGKWLNDHGVL